MDTQAAIPMKYPRSALFWMLVLVAAVDLVLIIASGYVSAAGVTRITTQLNLGDENNAAVWWSSATLLLAGLLLFDSAFQQVGQRVALLIIATLLVFLSLDEMGSLHERIFTGSYWSFVPYGLAGGLSFLYAVWQLYKEPTMRPIAILLFLGFSCFGSVVVQEYFEHNVNWPVWALGLRVGVEEGTELMGTALCLVAASKLLGFDKTPSLTLPAFAREAKPVAMGVAVLMVLVAVYAAFRAPGLGGYPSRGNPALWFAMATFFYLAYHSVRGQDIAKATSHHFLVVGLALVASLAQCMFVYTHVELWMLITVDVIMLVAIGLVFLAQHDWARPASITLQVASGVLMAALVFLGLKGQASAAFLLSFTVAGYLLAQSIFSTDQSQ